MLISLHKQAATTPKIRAAIQASDEPAWVLADRYGISEQTVWKWRKRDGVHDLSHTPHRLQCVALGGVSCTVFAITFSRTSLGRGGTREGRVLSLLSPGTPSSRYRSCQRQTVGFDMPVRRMISTVP